MPVAPSVRIFPQECYREWCIIETCVLSHSKVLLQRALEHVAKGRSAVCEVTLEPSNVNDGRNDKKPPEPAQHSSGTAAISSFCLSPRLEAEGEAAGLEEAARRSPEEEGSLARGWMGSGASAAPAPAGLSVVGCG